MGNRAKLRLLSDWQLGRILSGSVKGQGDGIGIPQYINCNLVGNKIGGDRVQGPFSREMAIAQGSLPW